MAFGVARAGGLVSWVGVPHDNDIPFGVGEFMLTGGVAPARANIEELQPDVLDGTVEPGKVFDRTIGIEDIPDGYRAMADREALKVLIRP